MSEFFQSHLVCNRQSLQIEKLFIVYANKNKIDEEKVIRILLRIPKRRGHFESILLLISC